MRLALTIGFFFLLLRVLPAQDIRLEVGGVITYKDITPKSTKGLYGAASLMWDDQWVRIQLQDVTGLGLFYGGMPLPPLMVGGGVMLNGDSFRDAALGILVGVYGGRRFPLMVYGETGIGLSGYAFLQLNIGLSIKL